MTVGDKRKEDHFWRDLDTALEKRAMGVKSRGRKVNGFNAIWYLFLFPLTVFIKAFFLSSNIFKGLSGLRRAVRKAVSRFAVNARIYEIENRDTTELERIKGEWSGRDYSR